MIRILVSACLLGTPVRYNGAALSINSTILRRWQCEQRIVSFCPETAAGLPTPRPPAEILRGDGADVLDNRAQVIETSGRHLTEQFKQGAAQTLELCRKQSVRLAILADGSPSCGSSYIYDGTFSKTKSHGVGVTTALLEKHNIKVFSQHQIPQAEHYLKQLDER